MSDVSPDDGSARAKGQGAVPLGVGREELVGALSRARCILWHAHVEGLPGWQEDVAGRKRRFHWRIEVYDAQAAQQVLPLEVAPGGSYFLAWRDSRHPEDDNQMWATAANGLVDIGYVKATGDSVIINLPKSATLPEVSFEWKIPKWSNAIERNRARTYFQAYAAACALYFCEQALGEVRAGHNKTWSDFKVPEEAIGCGFHEAVRGVLSHHVVIRDGKIANYHPYPPTPWNASPRDVYGAPGPYEDAVQGTPIFEENGPDNFKGIDIMRTVRSFDPCLPCGVHMYLGPGKTLETLHSPMFGFVK